MIWRYQLLQVWWSLASKDLVGPEKYFKINSGFRGQPLKRGQGRSNVISPTNSRQNSSCSILDQASLWIIQTTMNYNFIFQIKDRFLTDKLKAKKNGIRWSIPEEHRTQHDDITFVRLEKKDISGHLRCNVLYFYVKLIARFPHHVILIVPKGSVRTVKRISPRTEPCGTSWLPFYREQNHHEHKQTGVKGCHSEV